MRNRILMMLAMFTGLLTVAYADPVTCYNNDDSKTYITHTVTDNGTNSFLCKGESCGQMDRCTSFSGNLTVSCQDNYGDAACTTCFWWELYYDDFTPPEQVFWDDMFLEQIYTQCENTGKSKSMLFFRCCAPGYNWHSYFEIWNSSCYKAVGSPIKYKKFDFSS